MGRIFEKTEHSLYITDLPNDSSLHARREKDGVSISARERNFDWGCSQTVKLDRTEVYALIHWLQMQVDDGK